MVETVIGLHSFIDDVSPLPSNQGYKLPIVECSGKILELHKNNKISIIIENTIFWMNNEQNLDDFLNVHFSSIQKIGILKKIFHGIHTEERSEAIRYLRLLKSVLPNKEKR
ncbi:MAG: hypothetical protein JW776_07350 [Candidatus Lokiarchaeota archaeon]|nr:hypothetical protein [Candidatus Lokiarchaeota archaeon]